MFAPFIPDFAFRLIQLAGIPFEAIRGTTAGILILRTMKAERVSQLLGAAVWDESLFTHIPREIFELVLRYILAADIDKAAFETMIMGITNSVSQFTAMTLAQQYRKEGKHQGRKEGEVSSRQEMVLEVLEIRFGQVPEGLRAEVLALTEVERLQALHRAAVRCESLERFVELM